MVELGDDQPRTLANAFRKAVALRGEGNDVFVNAMQALQVHLQQLDAAYGQQTQRAQLSVTPPALAGLETQPLAGLLTWLKSALQPAA
jgi:CRISPR system Cascade subunit CasC